MECLVCYLEAGDLRTEVTLRMDERRISGTFCPECLEDLLEESFVEAVPRPLDEP